jgi:acetyl-CoA acyltransferase
MRKQYGIDSMPQTGDNVAIDYNVSREDQDAFAMRSQNKAAIAVANGRFDKEITPVTVLQQKGNAVVIARMSIHARPVLKLWQNCHP